MTNTSMMKIKIDVYKILETIKIIFAAIINQRL